VPDAAYLDALDAAYRYAEATSGDEVPTTFELLTLTAFLVFRRLQCDWVVLETGLGGRLDATNVVEPVATVITPIELEHTEYLGDSLSEIAAEKAGIVKPGVPLFLSPQHDEAREVLTRVAAERGAGCYELEELLTDLRVYNSTQGSAVSMQFRGDPEPHQCTLAMIGRMQAQNASLALLVGRTLFPETDTGCLLEALAETRLAGRFEILWSGASHSAAHVAAFSSTAEDRIPVVLDGAHTPHSIEALRTSFLELFGAGGVLIFGCAANKRHDAMADLLAPYFSHCVVARPGTFKQSEPERIVESFRKNLAETRCELILEPEPALRRAVELARRTPARAVLVTGSFYLVSEIRARLMLDSGETHSL
jgi:dihydrofolate synthase/folylpolyglutamate synthase